MFGERDFSQRIDGERDQLPLNVPLTGCSSIGPTMSIYIHTIVSCVARYYPSRSLSARCLSHLHPVVLHSSVCCTGPCHPAGLAPHHTTPHHITPHHTTPHHITPHHTTPHHTTPHHTPCPEGLAPVGTVYSTTEFNSVLVRSF